MNLNLCAGHFQQNTTPAEFKVLSAIIPGLRSKDDQVEISIREIVTRTGLNKGTVSINLRSLCAKGILKRNQRCCKCNEINMADKDTCYSCKAHLDNRALIYKVIGWPKDMLQEETPDQVTHRMLKGQEKILVGIREEMRELHAEVGHLRRDIETMTNAVCAGLANVADAVNNLSTVLLGNTPTPPDKGGRRPDTTPLNDTTTNVPDNVIIGTFNGRPVDEIDMLMLDLTEADLDPVGTPTEETPLGQDRHEAPEKPGDSVCMYSGSFSLSYLTPVKVLLRNTCAPGAPFSRQEHVNPAPEGKLLVFPSNLERLLAMAPDHCKGNTRILWAAERLIEELAEASEKYERWKIDAASGFYDDLKKPAAPRAEWNKAVFAREVIQRLYPGAPVDMKLLMKQLKKRGFGRYVDEQLSFYQTDLDKKITPVMIPHVCGIKLDLEKMA